MTAYSESSLEERITEALTARADSLPPASLPIPTARHAGHRAVIAVAVLVVAAALAVASVAVVVSPHPSDKSALRTLQSRPPSPRTATSSVPAGAIGTEISLAFVETPDTDHLVRVENRQGTNVAAVQAMDSAPVVVWKQATLGQPTQDCMTIAAAPNRAAGYQGACVANGASSLLIVADTGPSVTPATRAYLAWIGVPAGTQYVDISDGEQRYWQRPVDGITYLSHTGSVRAWAASPPLFTAYDDHGQRLGAARVPAAQLALAEQLGK
ncbi:MAG: hypothetical protein JOZ99_00055 [Actinobacteria bacterium]|nr:hypothetical protein [Actinomycetota bacterium]